MMREHPEAYPRSASIQLTATPLRDQIVAPARKALLLLLAAAGLVFVIACANVANLMLARAVRRDSELAIRAALGAGTGALRRALLVETLVLCGAGAALGVLLARPLVSVVGGYAGRFSVRALDVTVDGSLLWVSAGLAMAAAVALAFVPRLPSPSAPAGFALAGGGVRMTPGTARRLRVFAIAQIALSFVLLAGAGALLAALSALQTANTGYNLRQVLVVDIPMPLDTAGIRVIDFFQEVTRRVSALPGVQQAAVGNFAPWRDAGILLPAFPYSGEGHTSADGEPPHARLRAVSPGFFAALGVPIVAGRDFTGEDRRGYELVVILSQSAARRLFPEGSALNRHFWWTDPLFGQREPRRIVGVVQDVDDEHVVPGPVLTVYHPLQQVPAGGRLFVHADGDPYALVPAVTRIVHEMSPEQPVERAATLADVRTEVLRPERLNAFVFSVFAGVALLVAVVGVAGVLAFSVSARTHEFGVRLAIGSSRWRLLWGVLSEGTLIATIGIAAGAGGGYALGRAAVSALDTMRVPVAIPVLGAATVLIAAVAAAALMPAAHASRVDVIQALRAE
jgi:predicted permease